MTFAPFDALMAGRLLEAIILPYYTLIGNWFYLWLFGMGLLMLYNKTSNFGTVGVIGITAAAHIFPLLPAPAMLVAYAMTAISITVILYRTYK